MDMVNLEKIRDLLEKGVDNPLIQNEEGNFSEKKWKKEVQEYTEPLLRSITESLNEIATQENVFWKRIKFKIVNKREGKQNKISSLQDAKCKLPEPFAIDARDNDRRPVEGFIVIGPSSGSAGENYTDSVCWGLRWWGTAQKAQDVHNIFNSLNVDGALTASVFSDGNFGTFAWLFNSMNDKELARSGVESIAEIIAKDFLKLSSILYENIKLFPPPGEGPGNPNSNEKKYHPTRDDVEKAVLGIWSKTGRREINKSEVLKIVEAEIMKKGITLEPDWLSIIEGKLDDWFG